MIIFFILGIVLGAFAVVFALQNITVVTVTFFSWQLTGSLALILSLAIGTGVLIALLFILPESISNYFKYRSLKKENKKLEEDLRKQKELTVFAKVEPATPEEIKHLEGTASDDRHNI